LCPITSRGRETLLRTTERLSEHTGRFSVGTSRPRDRTGRLSGRTRRVPCTERTGPVHGKRGVMGPPIEVRAKCRAARAVRQDGFVGRVIQVARRRDRGRSARHGRSRDRTARVFVLRIRDLMSVQLESPRRSRRVTGSCGSGFCPVAGTPCRSGETPCSAGEASCGTEGLVLCDDGTGPRRPWDPSCASHGVDRLHHGTWGDGA